MQKKSIFDVLVLICRPAAGKCQMLNHLENRGLGGWFEIYHIGQMDVIDDFPMLWTWFEEEETLSAKTGSATIWKDQTASSNTGWRTAI